METNSSSVYQGAEQNKFPINYGERISQVQLNPEELRILRECNRESFYYRCLPFALTGMAAVYVGFQRGVIKGHPRWGPAFKMTGAAFLGWLVGKFSYRTKCEDKFIHLQNSTLADAIRKKRGYVVERFESDNSSYSNEQDLSLRIDSPKNDNRNDTSSGDFHSSSRSLNFDANVPSHELDDRNRPSLDHETDDSSIQSLPVKSYTTYEELRRRNRDEFEIQQRQPEAPRRPYNSSNFNSQRRINKELQDDTPKNIYGDSWENTK